ncbi:MAG: LysR family transcriptional regulator [Rhizobium sp.]
MDIVAAMRIFARVVEHGSLSKAARDLGMGQPTISERITKLEAHLGEQLLNRSTRSVRPTDIGLLFYERAKKALDATSFAESVSLKCEGALEGAIRVAAPHGLGEMVLPQALMRFRRLYPHVNVDLILNDRIVSPRSEGIDVSFRLGDRPAPDCEDEEIGHVERVLVVSPGYIADYGIPTVPEELPAHPFLRVAGIFEDGNLPLRRRGDVIAAPIKTVWTVSHWRPLHALLLAGAGIGVLQLPACAEALAAGQLKRILPQYDVPGFRLRMLHGPTDSTSEVTRRLLVFLRSELQFLKSESGGRGSS